MLDSPTSHKIGFFSTQDPSSPGPKDGGERKKLGGVQKKSHHREQFGALYPPIVGFFFFSLSLS